MRRFIAVGLTRTKSRFPSPADARHEDIGVEHDYSTSKLDLFPLDEEWRITDSPNRDSPAEIQNQPYLPDFTTATEQGACRATFVDTLPSMSCLMSASPLAPNTTKS